eukprot:c17964_g1_i1.p1 GENE.c17964_g1_i1~~c17964_g1_i1.p1  ORF type:complete len:500 (+),score=93.51 c17964_g1_i1:26-1525(+)
MSEVIDLTLSPPKKRQADMPSQTYQPIRLIKSEALDARSNRDRYHLTDVITGNALWAVVCNYMIDLPWFLSACNIANIPKVLLFHGCDDVHQQRIPGNFDCFQPSVIDAYGTHHSKAFVLFYDSGVRVCVCTANLLSCDWNSMTQGLWQQDFPLKTTASASTSPFEIQLTYYFEKHCQFTKPNWNGHTYQVFGRTFFEWIRQYDFSSATVRLLTSVPGRHVGSDINMNGHMQLRSILSLQNFPSEFRGSPVLCQFSSLGSLGKEMKWFREFHESLCAGACDSGNVLGKGQSHLVLPTTEEVRRSHEGYASGQSMPVSLENAAKVPFSMWCRWSNPSHPSPSAHVMPHIKTYTRYHPNGRLAWFALTSCNLSQAAWGVQQKANFFVRSWELGVLVIPSLLAQAMVHPNFTFCCTSNNNNVAERAVVNERWLTQTVSDEHAVYINLPYPVPPIPYTSNDVPWSRGIDILPLDQYGRCNECVVAGDRLYPSGNRQYGYRQNK